MPPVVPPSVWSLTAELDWLPHVASLLSRWTACDEDAVKFLSPQRSLYPMQTYKITLNQAAIARTLGYWHPVADAGATAPLVARRLTVPPTETSAQYGSHGDFLHRLVIRNIHPIELCISRQLQVNGNQSN
ncbi:uncharacterized protein EI90DRAFT_3014984 [Cantharellus anzutake]|uniref:uncharacterized protein n=1 Tax=Cantharellus anzutake TaxID=1750568 RepID=UPI001904E2CB|nr:uncharacterized protein EI90DRAFT_3014984 [Cantharellus anzutake]KAF8334740.1 hypothetical protein EI90DRAFT_3014984 [Cantharellus anzutake]